MSISRILSLIVAGLYLLVAYLTGASKSGGSGSSFFLIHFAPLIFPLVCIWYGDEVGNLVVGRITLPSAGWAVRLMGWVLLILISIGMIILDIRMKE